jgi:L-alanine-DL-glutamate epimerase-like enolase superfamily enzyme
VATPLRLSDVRAYRLNIPMRVKFEHAAATRSVADPIVVEVTAHAPYAHISGFGETLARGYVTGESADTVLQDLRAVFSPRLYEFSPASFAEALEFIESLALEHEGRLVHAARCALELALLDLSGRAFGRSASDVAGWLGLPGFGPPGATESIRYSGIVLGKSQRTIRTSLRVQQFYGLRDFKLKVATPGWEDRARWAAAALARGLARREVTLRADANSGWSLAEAHAGAELLESLGVCAIEQPMPEGNDADIAYLAEQTGCAFIADESLRSMDDLTRLLEFGGVQIFNLRLAKNGGLMPTLRMARAVLQAGREVQLGCLVGETGILTAAGHAFLRACPRVRFAEGAFGRFLLRADVTRPSLRFGWGGKLRGVGPFGLGVHVSQAALKRLATEVVTIARF